MATPEHVPAGNLAFEHLGRMVEFKNTERRYAVQGRISSISHTHVLRRVSIEVDLGGRTFTEGFSPEDLVVLLGEPEF